MPPQETPARIPRQKDENKKTLGQSLREWVQVIIIALMIALPFRILVAEPFIVQGASMDPTFSTGQFLIVDRLTYRFEEPKRGDVIVFKYPNNPNIYYIKRIIGLPGETVSIKDGKVTITNDQNHDGIKLNEPYIEASHASAETLKVTLDPTEYFVIGDNRAQSSDSRSWGPLDRHFIVGRPIVRLLPVGAVSIFPGEYRE